MRAFATLLPAIALIASGLAACSAPPAPPAAPPVPSPKVSPDMAGRVSPVPGFVGLGEHFHIRIHAIGDMRHEVELTWAMGQETAKGLLVLQDAHQDAHRELSRDVPGAPPRGPIVLDGTLDHAGGTKAIRVEIVTEPCTDEADRPHAQRVTVALEGDTTLHGCGDLAVY